MAKDWMKDKIKPITESEHKKLDEIAEVIFTEDWQKYLGIIEKEIRPKNQKMFKDFHKELGKFTSKLFNDKNDYKMVLYEFSLNLIIIYNTFLWEHKKSSINPLKQ